MAKKYYCPIASEQQDKLCEYGGNKAYNYGFMSGTASFCRKAKKWVHSLERCPLLEISGLEITGLEVDDG